jgi:hypothetical protein
MKTSATILAILLTAGAAAAQDATRPDYSKEAVQKVVMSIDIEEEDSGVRFYPDSVTFGALGTTWNFNYLPGPRMRLSGTEIGTGVTQQQPNPFALTNTVLATGPRAMARARRQIQRELRRIENRIKADAKIKVDTK